MQNGYADELSIDRIDNNKGYNPNNCRWTNNIIQARNKRNNHFITFNNETKTLSEWCEITGLKHSTVIYRLKKGWSVKDALTKPLTKNNV
jgi:hypothetical protein